MSIMYMIKVNNNTIKIQLSQYKKTSVYCKK